MVVVGTGPPAVRGATNITTYINNEDRVIAPSESFGYYTVGLSGDHYIYVVLDENGDGFYNATEQYMNVSVSTSDNSFNDRFPAGKTAGLDGTYDVYAVSDNSFPDKTLDAGDNLTSGTPAQVTIDGSAPWVSDVNLTNPSGQTLEFSFTTNEQLNGTSVSLTGPEPTTTFTKGDFTETNDSGTYTYTVSYAGASDGDYTADVTLANDTVGNDAATNQSASALTDSVTVDTVPPGLQSIETEVGSTTAVLTFNESVVDEGGNALTAGDLQFTDGNGGGATSISSVSHTAGSDTATVTFDAAVSATDLGNDTIAPNASRVYDPYGNAAVTAAKSLRDTVGPNAPTGASASDINASNQGDYTVSVTLPDDHEAGTVQLSLDGGAVTNSTTVAAESDADSSGETVTFGNLDASGLAEGSISIGATFTDYGGNSNAAPGLASVTKDTGLPGVVDASISNAPIGTYDTGTQQTVTVAFDEALNQSISPTVEITNLNRTYAVSGGFDDATTWTGTVTIADDDEQRTATIAVSNATDTVGNVMTPDGSNTFQVDSTGPAKPDSTAAGNVTRSNRTDYNVTVTFVTNSQADEVSVKVTDGTTAVVSNRSITPGTETVTVTGIDVSSLDDGAITATALALDGGYANTEGYAAPTTVTKDTKRPSASSITIGDGEINDADAGTARTVTVTFDEAMNRSVSPTVAVTDLNRTYTVSGGFDSDTTWTGTVTIADDDETTTGNVTVSGAADSIGNGLVAATHAFSVDTETPTITGFGVTHTGGGTVAVSFNASESLDAASVALDTPSGTTTLGSFTESGSGPYEYTATYSSGGDGSYTATLDAARDAAGNDGATGQSDGVTVDTTPPTFGNPTPEGATVTDNESVLSVDIADATGSVDGGSIRVTVDDANGTKLAAVGTAHGGVSFGGGTLTIDPTGAGIRLADGGVNVTVSANDTAGNGNATEFSFVVDTTAPTFADPVPTGTVTDNRTAINVDIADATTNVDEGSIRVTLSNASGQLFGGGTATDGVSFGGGTLTIDPTGTGIPTLPNGTVTVNVSANDTVGNEGTTGYAFGVDVPPYISGFAATKAGGMDVDVSFDSTDQLDAVGVAVSGAESGTLTTSDFTATPDGTGGYTYAATYTGRTDGNYTFELVTADDGRTDGATGQTETVLVDDTAPAVTLSAPDGGATVRGGEAIPIEWTATDSVSVDTVSIAYSTDGGGNWTTVRSDTANDGTEDWTIPAVDSGSVSVRVSATDTSGNVGSDASDATFAIDSTAPTVGNYTVTNPGGQDVTVTFDADERLATISAAVSGSESGTLTRADFSETATGSGTYTYAATYAGSSDGNYTATLNVAADDAGNDGASGQSESADVDTTTPSLSNFRLTNPSGRNLTVAFDSDEPLGTLEVAISGAESATLTLADFSRSGTTYTATYRSGADGNYTATLNAAADGAGNDGASGETDGIGIDTTPPTISNVSVSNPTRQEVRLRFDSSERLSAVRVTVSGAETATLTRSNPSANGGTYVVTYTGSVDGTYTATLDQALDDAGNDGSSGESGTVTVDATPPSVSTVNATNPAGNEIRVRIESSEQLSSLDVAISGAENETLTLADFAENDTTYTASYDGSSDGQYDVTLVGFADTADNEGTAGQTDSVTLQARPPTISNFVATNPADRRVVVGFDSSDHLSAATVTIGGAENATLTLPDFTENGTSYTATYNGSVDGTYTATLDQALDDAGNDGSSGEVASVTINTTRTGTGGNGTGGGDGGGGGSGGNGSDGSGGSGNDGGGNGSSPGTGSGSDSTGTDADAHDPKLSVDVTRGTNETTNVSVRNADANQRVGVAFGNETGSNGVNLSRLNLTVERPMDYSLTVNASAARLGDASDFGGHAVGFVEVDHSVRDADIDGAGLTFRIDTRRFEETGMDATEAVVYRYHGGRWNALDTSVVGRDGGEYVLRADSPGLSVFAVGLRDADLLSVTGASLSKPSAAVGAPVTASATITNRGNWLANDSLAVTANGTTLAARTVTIPAGETVTVTFDVTRDHPGTYGIAIDDVSAGTVAFSRAADENRETSRTTTTDVGTTKETSTATLRATPGTTEKAFDAGTTRQTGGGPNGWLFAGLAVVAVLVALLVRRVR
ncbi:PGF-pre-PGF domain-containing protein [Haladaptatus paucihalophilus DX253]|uniref:PGF-pre-PGF domain-containing protein n=2 Tax=Haladaptatus paucihalophilus TaxID=367189 RepID=A0A1M6T8X0_HALPU|nr:PGF-pre-PGF domain-containing protein [Haladaptatus paucihalophilus DX253]